jgi:molecular chaperone IbpA
MPYLLIVATLCILISFYSKLSVEKNILKVQGASDKKDANYVHKGLATRKFQKAFHLAEHMEVGSAKSEDGILKINLVRNIPEEEKPKIIEIG